MVEEQYIIKLYKRRWINLLVVLVLGTINCSHSFQYSVISDTVSAYYSVPQAYVEWTTGVYSLSYILLFLPALYAYEKKKSKHILIIGSSLSALGALIKVFSVVPDRFFLVLIAQCITAASFTVSMGAPARLIASWFSVHESSFATALVFFSNRCGNAIGFMIPIIFVPENPNLAIWEGTFRRLHMYYAVISILLMALMILLFKDKPKYPPSIAEAIKEPKKSGNFAKTLKQMMKNRDFLMLNFWYSSAGFAFVIPAMLGQLLSINFQDSYDYAGKSGVITVIGCMISTPLLGCLLDKTRRFRLFGLISLAGTFITFIFFTLALKSNNIIHVLILSVFIGIFTTSSIVTGVQIGIEILYPISEDKCFTVIMFFGQLFTGIELATLQLILTKYGDVAAMSVICIWTFTCLVVCFLAPVTLNRQIAEQCGKMKETKRILLKPNHQNLNI